MIELPDGCIVNINRIIIARYDQTDEGQSIYRVDIDQGMALPPMVWSMPSNSHTFPQIEKIRRALLDYFLVPGVAYGQP